MRARLLGPALIAAAAFVGGCRADSGPDDYQSQEQLRLDAEPPPIDSSLRDGERRLGLGIFYEGPAEETVTLDQANANFFIYEETFAVTAEPGDRVEGAQSDRLSHKGGPWWGGGVHWTRPRDLTGWATLNLSLKSTDASFDGLRVALLDAADTEVQLNLADYDFEADGDWHDVVIPLTDFSAGGLDLTQVAVPLAFAGGPGARGESVLVDAVFISSL